MNGGTGSSEYLCTRGGRHRRGDAGTWTPGVSRKASAARHASAPGPVDLPIRGLLPIAPPGKDTDLWYPPSRGKLPVPQRTKVTLIPDGLPEPEDTEVVVHLVPPASGLGTFDLGSVPASVTPPRTWRRAAWFATASSGGVVVALLFAGSTLVSKPAPEQAALGWVPGLGGGGQPALDGQQAPPDPSRTTDMSTQRGGKAEAQAESSMSVGRPAAESHSPTREVPTGDSAPVRAPVDPIRPPKPSPGQASFDADPFRIALPQAAPAVLAESSGKFFDTVVENPEAAHLMTTGQLERQGSGALASKYADVAYFEVEHVQVHQYEGKTVCTMQTVHKDGTRTTEQRVLTFSHGKIDSVTEPTTRPADLGQPSGVEHRSSSDDGTPPTETGR